MRRMNSLLDEKPLDDWAMMRWLELLVSIHWLFKKCSEKWLLQFAEKAESQGYDWRAHFQNFKYKEWQPEWKLENHVVNNAMALKEPAVRFQITHDIAEAKFAGEYMAILDQYHGQATGVFSGDESLAGKNPSQGTELCAVVEYMYSLECLLAAFVSPADADRLEKITFNALPATFTTDMWAHQYVQQVNQAVCKLAADGERVYTNNGPESNLFGLEPNFGCCTANMHQGWPKFTSSLWMKTEEGGLAAISYAPCSVHTTSPSGTPYILTVKTEYPFRDEILISIDSAEPISVPLYLRIPSWSENATFQVGDHLESLESGQFHRIERNWLPGESFTLKLQMKLNIEQRTNNAISITRGPLLYALQIGERFELLKGDLPHADWQVFPSTSWNYALSIGRQQTIENIRITELPIGEFPFSPDTPATILEIAAKKLPNWQLEKNAAAPPPASPVMTDEPEERVKLVPYGNTHLRVAEFPVL